jgi:hypothetical protein
MRAGAPEPSPSPETLDILSTIACIQAFNSFDGIFILILANASRYSTVWLSFEDITTHATRADLEAFAVPVGLLLGPACPVRLERLRACIDLVQHYRVGFLQRHEYLELQGA